MNSTLDTQTSDEVFADESTKIDGLARVGCPLAFYEYAESKGYFDVDDIRGSAFMRHYDLFRRGRSYAALMVEKKLAERYTTYAQIVLHGFAPLESGEHVTVKEVRNRLGRLKDAGFSTRGHSHLDQKGLIAHFRDVRRGVRTAALKYCPSVVERIDRSNAEEGRAAL